MDVDFVNYSLLKRTFPIVDQINGFCILVTFFRFSSTAVGILYTKMYDLSAFMIMYLVFDMV